jgi:hypothetical protein
MLGVVEDHMLPLDVAGEEMCCCRLVLKLQEGKNVDQP